MKTLIALMMFFAVTVWSIPKPMESVEKYNIVLVHGAYQADKGI